MQSLSRIDTGRFENSETNRQVTTLKTHMAGQSHQIATGNARSFSRSIDTCDGKVQMDADKMHLGGDKVLMDGGHLHLCGDNMYIAAANVRLARPNSRKAGQNDPFGTSEARFHRALPKYKRKRPWNRN